MSDRLTKQEINIELDFYTGLFNNEIENIQQRYPDTFGAYALGHAFIWGHINVCINEMTGLYKTYKMCLGSVCSRDVYGLAYKAAGNLDFVTVSHINMD